MIKQDNFSSLRSCILYRDQKNIRISLVGLSNKTNAFWYLIYSAFPNSRITLHKAVCCVLIDKHNVYIAGAVLSIRNVKSMPGKCNTHKVDERYHVQVISKTHYMSPNTDFQLPIATGLLVGQGCMSMACVLVQVPIQSYNRPITMLHFNKSEVGPVLLLSGIFVALPLFFLIVV